MKRFELDTILSAGHERFWDEVQEKDLREFAIGWLASISNFDRTEFEKLEEEVILLALWAPLKIKLRLLDIALEIAETQKQIEEIATGLMEQTLAYGGAEAFSIIERRCEGSDKYLLALTGVWRHKIDAVTWAQVARLQSGSKMKLSSYHENGGPAEMNEERIKLNDEMIELISSLVKLHPNRINQADYDSV
jgi:hypothetical protein